MWMNGVSTLFTKDVKGYPIIPVIIYHKPVDQLKYGGHVILYMVIYFIHLRWFFFFFRLRT